MGLTLHAPVTIGTTMDDRAADDASAPRVSGPARVGLERLDPRQVDSRAVLAKSQRLLSRLGREAVEKVLVAYYVMRDDATPAKAKATLAGALAYFLLPTDAIADLLPGIGLTDDAMAITMALAAVATSIRRRHVEQARQTLVSWGLRAPADGGPA